MTAVHSMPVDAMYTVQRDVDTFIRSLLLPCERDFNRVIDHLSFLRAMANERECASRKYVPKQRSARYKPTP